MTLRAQVPLEQALETNSWYSPDLKLAAFLGADGRMCVIVNGAPAYLYPNVPEATTKPLA